MARWQLMVSGKGIRKASVEKLVKKFKDEFGKDCSISVTDATPPESRSDRFQAALSSVSDAKSEMESLRDEMQEWFDNLPENFQQGDKGSQLEEAIQELESVIDTLDGAEGTDVNFPGMY